MSGYIKYFENGGKNMSFLIKDDEVWENTNKFRMWLKINLALNFIASLFTNKNYLKAKVIKFDGVIKTNFWGNDMSKENMYYACIACIAIDSVMKIDKKSHPQV